MNKQIIGLHCIFKPRYEFPFPHTLSQGKKKTTYTHQGKNYLGNISEPLLLCLSFSSISSKSMFYPTSQSSNCPMTNNTNSASSHNQETGIIFNIQHFISLLVFSQGKELCGCTLRVEKSPEKLISEIAGGKK